MSCYDVKAGEVNLTVEKKTEKTCHILLDFLGIVKAAPHECVIGTGQP